ncbi:MAG: photosynthetic complex assembly protein PuhC [Pseudomonadota bacterium]
MAHDPEKIPRPLLFAVSALVIASVGFTGFATITGIGKQAAPTIDIVDSRQIQFRDQADGGVAVYDFVSGDRIWEYPPATGGFVRTAMRAVVHTRRVHGHGPETPFEIARTREGRLILKDATTDLTVGLEAFGAGNAAEFAQLLTAKALPHDAN